MMRNLIAAVQASGEVPAFEARFGKGTASKLTRL